MTVAIIIWMSGMTLGTIALGGWLWASVDPWPARIALIPLFAAAVITWPLIALFVLASQWERGQ